jgi:DnaJ-class molecular chaperone
MPTVWHIQHWITCPECEGRCEVRQIARDENDWRDWAICDRCGGEGEIMADTLEEALIDGAGI